MLTPYIKDLLYRYDRVIIPNFGGFETQKISAQIDEKTHVFSPPRKALTFNTDLTSEDNLLADYIVSKDHITKESADNFISFQVEEWHNTLESKPLTLDGIGVFNKDPQDRLHFIPDESSNFMAESFGLSQVNANQVSRTSTPEKTVSDVDEKPVTTPPKRSSKKGLAWWYYAAVLALLIGLATILYQFYLHDWSWGNNRKDTRNKAIEIEKPNRTIDLGADNRSENTVDKVNSDSTEAVKPGDTLTKPTKPEQNTSTVVTTTGKQYFIIVGAFGQAENADKKLNQLKAQGYTNALIVDSPHSRLTHVACGPYSSLRNSQPDLRTLKQNNPQAWVLKK